MVLAPTDPSLWVTNVSAYLGSPGCPKPAGTNALFRITKIERIMDSWEFHMPSHQKWNMRCNSTKISLMDPSPSGSKSLRIQVPQDPSPSGSKSLRIQVPQDPSPSGSKSLRIQVPQDPSPSGSKSLRIQVPQDPSPSGSKSLRIQVPQDPSNLERGHSTRLAGYPYLSISDISLLDTRWPAGTASAW